MTTGMYFSHGDLRKTALEMAIDSTVTTDTDAVIARADAYFRFLTAGEAQ